MSPRRRPPARAAPRRAKPRLSQHFLDDPSVRDRIAEALPDDGLPVLEIGPGQGVLTEALLARGRTVAAVELDGRLAAGLRHRFRGQPRFAVVEGDVLDGTARVVLAAGGVAPPYGLAGNLPYAITSAIFRRFLSIDPDPPEWFVVMVQREVAQRVVAPPGKRSLLSVSVQYYAEPELLFLVPPTAFRPPPEVWSAVLRIRRREARPVDVPSDARFFEVARAGFSSPRKQIHNALRQGLWLPDPAVDALLSASEIDPMRRAGTLTLEEWARLAWARERSGAPPPPALAEALA